MAISDLPSQAHADQSISATIRIPCRRVLNGTSSYTDDTYILLILSPDTRLIQFLPSGSGYTFPPPTAEAVNRSKDLLYRATSRIVFN